jgi:hypothetical protein
MSGTFAVCILCGKYYHEVMNWLTILLCVLSGVFALWAFAGLLCPKEALPFALPDLRTRSNAFSFPLRLVVICAIAAAGSVYGEDNDGIAIWAGLISGIMFGRACLRFSRLHGTPLQRMGIVFPSERHSTNQQ